MDHAQRADQGLRKAVAVSGDSCAMVRPVAAIDGVPQVWSSSTGLAQILGVQAQALQGAGDLRIVAQSVEGRVACGVIAQQATEALGEGFRIEELANLVLQLAVVGYDSCSLPCGAIRSSTGPRGTIPVALMWRWLP